MAQEAIPAILEERLPLPELLSFCGRHPAIQFLWVFGSVLNDWRADSDVDFLVRCHSGQEPDWNEWDDMKEELESLLGRKVDLINADWVENPFVKAHIRKTRVLVYGT